MIVRTDFKKESIYIYRVEYDNDTIHTLEYFQYDKKTKDFIVCRSNIHTFGLRLLNKEFMAIAGKLLNGELINTTEVVAYWDNGAPWIKSVDTKDHKEFLELAKKNLYDYKVPLTYYL
mgnify:CR=1 FL=1